MADNSTEFRWIENPEKIGEMLFTFDGITILTPEQKDVFDRENPYWANFFTDRAYDKNSNK